MSTSLRAKLHYELGWTWQDTIGSTATTNSNRLLFQREISEGSGEGQANRFWDATEPSLPSGTNTTLDLTSLERSFFDGTVTISFDLIKAIWVRNRNSSGTAVLQVGGASSAPWSAPFVNPTDRIMISPGGIVCLAHPEEGWAVDSTHKTLLLEAVGGDVEYEIALLGVNS